MRIQNLKTKVCLFGGGGHAKVIADLIELEQKFEIVGIVDPSFVIGQKWCEKYLVISEEEAMINIKNGIIALGDNWLRKKIYQAILQKNQTFNFISAIHPRATVASDVKIGTGTVVMAGAIVNPGCQIFDHVVVNTGAIIEHDCSLGNFSFIGPGACVGGEVIISENVLVGLGSIIMPRKKIGASSILGSGALLTNDLDSLSVAKGNPACVSRLRQADERFF